MLGYLPRIFFLGTAAILLQFTLGAAAMGLLGEPWWIGGLFLLGAPLGIYATRPMPALGFPTICLFAMTAVIPVFVVDAPLFGRVHDLRLVDDIPADRRVAGYTAPGWRIAAEYELKERLTAGRGRSPYGHRLLAPLVGDGWTPSHPVEVWVMGETRDSGRIPAIHPKFWSEAGGEYVRLVGKDVWGAQLQAVRAAAFHKLLTSQEPLIVTRRSSVKSAIVDQYVSLSRALVWPLGLWAAMFGVILLYWRLRARSDG